MQQLLCAVCLALQAAINSGDVERGESYFAPNAVVIQPRIGGMPQIYVGRDQIRWWLTSMTAQHAYVESIGEPELSRGHVHWPETLSIDAFRQMGMDRVVLDTDVRLTNSEQIESLTTILTPGAARELAGSLE